MYLNIMHLNTPNYVIYTICKKILNINSLGDFDNVRLRRKINEIN